MTKQNRSLKEVLNRSFLRSKTAPLPSVDAEWERLTDRHRDGDAGAFDAFESTERPPVVTSHVKARKPMWVAAAAMVIAGIALSIVFRPLDAAAKVASAEGALQRVSDGVAEGLNLDDPVRLGDTIRSKGEVGGSLVLAGGARIVMRSESELRLEPASDGVRIRLHNGGIIVDAGRQSGSGVYVETKDLTASLLGTVSLVKTEGEGSRVAVIQGQANVAQGNTERKVGPGEQVLSNPLIEVLLAPEKTGWSSEAQPLLAALQQNLEALQQSLASIAAAIPVPRQRLPANRWESISVQSCGQANAEGGARGGGVGVGRGNDAGLLRVTCMPLRYLLEMAYVKWIEPNAIRPRWFYPISGGPSWVDTELFTIRARANGAQNEQTLKGPMLQTLLEDRFKLKMQLDVIEEQVYELTVAPTGTKLQPLKDGECAAREARIDAIVVDKTDPIERLTAGASNRVWPCGAQAIGGPLDGSPAPPGTRTVNVRGGSLDLLIRNLSLDRIVLDRTDLKGLYDIQLTYSVVTSPMREPRPLPAGVVPGGDSIFDAFDRQLGLKLTPVKGPRNYYTIQYVERPTFDQ